MFSKDITLFLSKKKTNTCLFNWNLYGAYASPEIRAICRLVTRKSMKKLAWFQTIV